MLWFLQRVGRKFFARGGVSAVRAKRPLFKMLGLRHVAGTHQLIHSKYHCALLPHLHFPTYSSAGIKATCCPCQRAVQVVCCLALLACLPKWEWDNCWLGKGWRSYNQQCPVSRPPTGNFKGDRRNTIKKVEHTEMCRHCFTREADVERTKLKLKSKL